MNQKRLVNYIPYFLLAILMALVLQRAWVSDDAYISFRTIDNLINGYRLTWNPAERVQAYTHPLWMLLLALIYFFTHEIYLTSIFVSISITLITVVLFIRSTQFSTAASFGVLVLCLSNAFVDYATSGLENPLGHWLMVLFALVYFKHAPTVKKMFWLSLISSLAAVNRMDSILILVPCLLLAFWQTPHKGKSLLFVVIAQAPFILWEMFSLFYYGFLFPNTAYAKLNTFIPAGESVQQGFYYLLNSLQQDPVTLLVITAGFLASLLAKDRLRLVPLALGAVLYVGYVIKIGGDFMSGRFFTLPLMAAVIILGQIDLKKALRPWGTAVLITATLIMGILVTPVPTIRMLNPPGTEIIDVYGVADERLWYFSGMGLFRNGQFNPVPDHAWIKEGILARQQLANDVVIREGIGLYGYYAGPSVYIIDVHALTDPLLARLPAKRWVNWQIGHFERVIPGGHTDTMKVNQSSITDPELNEYNRKLSILTRGDLFSWERLVEIWKFNTGQYNYLINVDRYRFPNMTFATIHQLSSPVTPGSDFQAPGNLVFNDHGIEIDLQGKEPGKILEAALDGDDYYLVIFMRQKQELASLILPASAPKVSGMKLHSVSVPDSARSAGCDRIRILPIRTSGNLSMDLIRGDETYSIGYLNFK